MMTANAISNQSCLLRPSLVCASNTYGAADEDRIKESGTRSGRVTPAVLSSAMAASMDDATPACTVLDVRSTTAAIAMDLVIQPERAMSFHVSFPLAVNQRKEM